MRVLGLISGTSADGIDVALARIAGAPPRLRARLENFLTVPYPAPVRRAILRIAEGVETTAEEISQLNFLIGQLFAEAALAACRRFRVSPANIDLLGSHGQTIYHQGRASRFLGRPVASTLQIGEPAVIAARTSIPVVADFRPADMASGGQGAPLVPFVDFLLYRDARRGRVALNIGGIANVTLIPPASRPEDVLAFDTGPGNMVIDAVSERLFGQPYDHDGRIAARGQALEGVLARMLRAPFFRRMPPKTAGREEFGREFVADFLRRCRGARKPDIVATATALTARSIAAAVQMFLLPFDSGAGKAAPRFFHEFIVSGGGARNRTLLAMLRRQLPGLAFRTSDDLGLPAEAKEAVAFAVLAYQTWHRLPGNVPAATGAERPAVLGKISYP